MTVSNFVRNLVEDVIEIHGDVSDAIETSVKSKLEGMRTSDIASIQEMILHKDRPCDRCRMVMKKGKKAYVVLYEGLKKQHIVCVSCKEKLAG